MESSSALQEVAAGLREESDDGSDKLMEQSPVMFIDGREGRARRTEALHGGG